MLLSLSLPLSNPTKPINRTQNQNITTFYGVTASPDWLIVTELLHGSLYRLLHSQSASLPLKLQMRIAKVRGQEEQGTTPTYPLSFLPIHPPKTNHPRTSPAGPPTSTG